jgi:hypothetical protein
LAAELDFVSLIEDPRRNGIMFAELISFLYPTALDGTHSIIQTPKTVADCQQNLSRVFAAISKLELSHGQTLKRLLTE